MDGALVGGAFLSSFLNVLFDRMASPQVVAFFRGQKVNGSSLLQKLETAMTSLRVVLDDAEEKQITNRAVRDWLDQLKDAVYKADDFLDEIAYEALRGELEAEGQTFTSQLLSFINPLEIVGSREIEEKLKVLLQDLDPLVERMAALGLNNRNVENPSSHRTPTTSLVDGSGVYGRDDDREAILTLLLSEDANGESPGVVPIRGMGGVGKTTLAQLVYNHSRVQKRFDLKAWVCVSEDFSVLKLTNVILEAFGSKPASDNLDQLQLLLKDRLEGKRFLLVLDDVWNEDYAEWDKLLTPLKYGAQGMSKILVTTRNESVASVMRTVPTHHLKELKEDSCWSLFAKHAFRGENPTAHEELQEIGRAIARKCKGLPLAAVTLGGLLRTQRDVEEWEKILESNLWDLPKDNILPALRLSYLYLPPHLKQCFAYCAIFPKDYEFKKDELVLLWMAEGFLVHSKDDEMERAGAECFDDLLSRSFFQKSSASRSSFMMHDLMHDLATMCPVNFASAPGWGKIILPRPAEGLDIYHSDGANMLRSTSKLKHLRYLDLSQSDLVTLPEEVSALLNLQTLILDGCHRLASLPDLGNLKHLRHLNLQGTVIERLPESLERLINLRYLNISDTPLKEMPPHIGQLTKLQTLAFFLVGRQSETSIKELGNLRHLRGELHIRNLQNVVDARDAGEANLKGKKHLDKLRFTWDGDTHDPQHVTSTLEKLEPNRNVKNLRIYGYGGIRFPEWVGESSFSNIVSLKLSGCTNCISLPPLGQLASLEDLSIVDFDKVETVGSEFYGNCTAMKKPFESLKTLTFRRMPEWREWISDEGSREAFSLLDKLSITECSNLAKVLPRHHLPRVTSLVIRGCKQLATPLPRFPRLDYLNVSGFDSLESLPGETDQMGWSPSDLKEIHINGCASLKCVALDLLPKLKSLSISDCPDLESLCAHERPLNDLTSLHSLRIENCPKLVSFPKGGLPAPVLTHLKEIHINGCASLKCVALDLLPKLKSLSISDCPDLESLCAHERPLNDLTSLHSLRIENCPKLVSFPKGGLPAPVLTRLDLGHCSNLKQLPESMHSLLPSLIHLEIKGCSEVELCPEGGFPSTLQSLEISNCNKLIAGRMQWGLQTLPSLSDFTIGWDENVGSFPEEMLLPSSLTYLQIYSLKHLKSLPRLQHLTSLTSLRISDCPLIESMPEEGLPSSLSFLLIYNCPMLKSLPRLQHLTSLTSLFIWYCPLIESMPEEGLPSSLSTLVISYCSMLKSLPRLQHLTSLTQLEISDCPLIESMPEEGLPSSLSTLKIYSCRMLKSLPRLQHLTSLRQLSISHCPMMESMPEEGLPSSLSTLRIEDCPMLGESCEREKGKDWPKISHIPRIYISGAKK
ncbi:LOW QUALITY PROTEIN: putative disease resistance RPP13-like protein 1 [Populus alba]|uniref:LOW QUALITY PROTEIN: putative disease resistance RPP13-like protein 1 n=1 Tax=Populus alba TaxID=43335 RepID=UPI003CC73337